MNIKELSVVSYVSVVDEEDREIQYPLGKYWPRVQAISELISGKIVQVVFKKKSGVITSRNVVAKSEDQKTGKAGSNYVCATDIHKKRLGLPPLISINIKGMLGIVSDGKMHIIKEAISGEDSGNSY